MQDQDDKKQWTIHCHVLEEYANQLEEKVK